MRRIVSVFNLMGTTETYVLGLQDAMRSTRPYSTVFPVLRLQYTGAPKSPCSQGIGRCEQEAVHWCSHTILFTKKYTMLVRSSRLVPPHHSVHKESRDVSKKQYTGNHTPPCSLTWNHTTLVRSSTLVFPHHPVHKESHDVSN